jgi:hypothetical protein
MKITVILLSTILLLSCAISRKGIIIVDDNMNPSESLNQLEVSTERGEVGRAIFASPGSQEARSSYQVFGSKKWIFDHWGNPDAHNKKNLIDYYIFRRNDEPIFFGVARTLNEKNSVKLGFHGDRLVYVETFIERPDPYMKGPVYVLPK